MLVKTMRAAILVEQKQPLVIDEVMLPDHLEYGQVLVKLHYSGICGSQIGEITGVKGPDAWLPHLLGHEASGVVLEIGEGVTTVQTDDPVVLHWRKGLGIESRPPKYQWQGKQLNAGFITTFNEYAIVSENRLTSFSKDYPMKLAPLFGCAVTTGIGVITNNANLKLGESLVVMGAGGVGLNVVQGGALHSAYPIIAIDIFENRLALAKQLGATHTINSKKQKNWPEQVKSILGVKGTDVFVDNTGNPEIIAEGWKLTKDQGRTILVGVPAKGKETHFYTLPLHFGKNITGSHGGNGNPSEDIPRYMKLSDLGILELSGLITEMCSIEEINQAIERMRNGKLSGRCLIEFDSEHC
jgi:S-(hydroxymethyl)glutathione dehydrogenase / alcohol dehydrogenase